FGVGGLLLTASSVWFEVGDGHSAGNPFLGIAGIAYGIYCARQARRQVTRTLLTIDRSGIRSEDGSYDQSWAGVVMVWVGSSTGLRLPLVGQPVLSLFTSSGVDFARRAGTPPKARCSVPVGLPWTVDKLCVELRRITDAPVLDGSEVSRSSAAALLQRQGSGG
ncbi:MAG: hypothetical protein ACRYG2_30490, partial [Janthinobacterium lividum]